MVIFLSIPTIRPGYLGLPTTVGIEHLGVSSPEIHALINPEQLSITIAGTISSAIFKVTINNLKIQKFLKNINLIYE